MPDLSDTITITVEYYTGKEEEPHHAPYYVAYCDSIGLVTDGDTFDELLEHLREALAVCLEGVDTVAEYGIKPDPHIVLMMDMNRYYAEAA